MISFLSLYNLTVIVAVIVVRFIRHFRESSFKTDRYTNTSFTTWPAKHNRIAGTRILILGGSTGLGFSAAEAAVEHNAAQVTISSSSQAKVDTAVNSLKQSYPTFSGLINGFSCDLKSKDVEQGLVELLTKSTAVSTTKLDHIIHCAGDPLAAGPVDSITLDGIIEAGMVRYFSTILLGKVAPAFMVPGSSSSITLTTGSVARKPIKDWVVIGGFGAGLEGVARGLALDLAPLRVNCVGPGVIDTGLWDSSMGKEAADGLKKAVGEKSLTGRVGQPADIAQLYMYLLQDWNATGSVVFSDGGSLIL